jgi:hypothetical protein
MAKLKKKFSELSDKVKTRLKNKHGGKKAAQAAHSQARKESGNKADKPKKKAVKLIKADKGKLKLKEAKKIADRTGLSIKKITKLASNKVPDKKLGNKYQQKVNQANLDAVMKADNYTPPSTDKDDKTKDNKDDKTKDDKSGGGGDKDKTPIIGGQTPTAAQGTKIQGKGTRKNIYTGLIGSNKAPLKKKAQYYAEMLGGKTGRSQEYIDALKSEATKRMTINPEKYGRSKEGTPFENLSLAEKYDKERTTLLDNLRKPLAAQLKAQSDSGSELNMFSGDSIEFNPAAFSRFASAGSKGEQIKSTANSLGIGDRSSSDRITASLGKINAGPKKDYSNTFKQQLSFV